MRLAYFRQWVKSGLPASTLAIGSAGTLITKAGGGLLLFASQTFLAAQLGTSGYGAYVITLAVVNLILVVTKLGLDVSSVRFVATFWSLGDWGRLKGFLQFSRMAAITATATGSLALAAVASFFPSLAPLAPVLLLAAVVLPLDALAIIFESSLRGRPLGSAALVAAQVPMSAVHPLVVFGMAAVLFLGLGCTGPEWAIAGYGTATLVALFLLALLSRRSLPAAFRDAEPRSEAVSWLRASAPMILLMGFSTVSLQSIVLLTGIMLGQEDAGLFGAAQRVANTLLLLPIAVNTVLAPMVARLHALGDRQATAAALRFGLNICFATMLPLAVAFGLLADPVLALMGAEFQAARPSLLILLVGQVFYAATAPAGHLLNMSGQERIAGMILLIGSLATPVSAYLSIAYGGLIGAALAASAVPFLVNLAMAAVAHRRLGLLPIAFFVDRYSRKAGGSK